MEKRKKVFADQVSLGLILFAFSSLPLPGSADPKQPPSIDDAQRGAALVRYGLLPAFGNVLGHAGLSVTYDPLPRGWNSARKWLQR